MSSKEGYASLSLSYRLRGRALVDLVYLAWMTLCQPAPLAAPGVGEYHTVAEL